MLWCRSSNYCLLTPYRSQTASLRPTTIANLSVVDDGRKYIFAGALFSPLFNSHFPARPCASSSPSFWLTVEFLAEERWTNTRAKRQQAANAPVQRADMLTVVLGVKSLQRENSLYISRFFFPRSRVHPSLKLEAFANGGHFCMDNYLLAVIIKRRARVHAYFPHLPFRSNEHLEPKKCSIL